MLQAIRRFPTTAAAAGYLALAAASTWPLLPRFTREIGGDRGDAWQTLWGFWWFRDALGRGTSPFFCDALRWPWGVPLWLQTFDLPAAVALLPAWALVPAVPEVALYNAVLFASYPLAGLTASLLCVELWGDRLAGFLAGALYTTSTYHFAHALGHLHVVSMEWSPLYFLGLVRTFRRSGPGGPLLGGAGLALATFASPYHLLLCALGTLALVAAWARAEGRRLLSGPVLRRAVLLGLTFLALAGWLLAGMARSARSEPFSGAHDAVFYSADLLSFFVPNAASAWRDGFGAWRRFTGNAAESAAYVGYVPLLLAVGAGWRAKASRAWLLVAAFGFALALGPFLHVGGEVYRGVLLPYGWLERLLPALRLGGVPTRLSWLVTLGVTVAAGAMLAQLVRSGRRGPVLACAVAALALAESWPHAFVTSSWPAPRFLRNLALDPERWAVLDATDPQRQLWHGVLHRHPQVGGYVTRAPARLDARLADTPVLRPFFVGGPPIPADESIPALQELGVRFVIVDDSRLAAGRALLRPAVWEGDGIHVYEVPARAEGR